MTQAVLNPAGLHGPVPFGYSHTARIPAGLDSGSGAPFEPATRVPERT